MAFRRNYKIWVENFSSMRLAIIVDFYIFVLQAKIKVFLSGFFKF